MIVAVVALVVVVGVHCNTVFLLTFDGKMCLFVLNEPTAHTNLFCIIFPFEKLLGVSGKKTKTLRQTHARC